MNKSKLLFILTVLLVSSFYTTYVSIEIERDGFLSTFASSSGSANIVKEGNSTFLNSKPEALGQQNVSTVIIIPNPISNSRCLLNEATIVDIIVMYSIVINQIFNIGLS